MKTSKKCAICNYEFAYNIVDTINPLLRPRNDGAKYYYSLWHYPIEKCPNCGYCAKDISKTYNKHIIEDSNFLSSEQGQLLMDLYRARPNNIDDYIKASIYYDSIGEQLLSAISLLQAGDLVYAELIYWEDYIWDSATSISAVINKSQYNEIKQFAESLFTKATEKLEQYIKSSPNDIDAQIVLAGTYSDGDKVQHMKSLKILNSLTKIKVLTNDQKSAISFLLDDLQ